MWRFSSKMITRGRVKIRYNFQNLSIPLFHPFLIRIFVEDDFQRENRGSSSSNAAFFQPFLIFVQDDYLEEEPRPKCSKLSSYCSFSS